MGTSVAKITEQIAHLDGKHLAELEVFVEFLLNKQGKTGRKAHKKTKKGTFMADIQAIPVPVSHFIVQREEIYEDRL